MSDGDRSPTTGSSPGPDADERPPFVVADERTTLLTALDYLRGSVIRKATGLPEAELRRPMVASGTNLLGLVAHLTSAELFWFAHTFAGADDHVPPIRFTAPDELDADRVVDGYRRATARSNEVVAAAPEIDTPCARTYRGGDTRLTLRWVLVHMIEETARHAGHADILREQLDGSTGR